MADSGGGASLVVGLGHEHPSHPAAGLTAQPWLCIVVGMSTKPQTMKPATIVRTCGTCGHREIEAPTPAIQTLTGIFRAALIGHCA